MQTAVLLFFRTIGLEILTQLLKVAAEAITKKQKQNEEDKEANKNKEQ
ncbi:hypothetical protein [Aeromonas phage AS-yj]|uniref:Uncharacterized protein n=7 Tax=Caudoviricetes TaxID=2731619 RepID=A0A291LEH0_9CAUD|nr:hypothetical protein F485_gp057 [Aeromonas phage CC2]YP_009834671.1 hypothetical protein HWB28_gp371 [Aeromonas phage AS-zj]YP_009834906.1 hypothetical protein HWB29_gp204 [Aeromonas phage AS-sw]ATI17415.1 hypothetical protein [Aeromonas phage AS-szw]ATI17679.1 hypothetical protein [Aeromonas phage AS-yj]QAX97855.1 hypothetical protein ASswx1_212 [Aeromonas phage Asswx_1]QAX99094.1 hypothetical protein assk_306 [Aeromonas phage Assk]QMV28722.1 hypothetical protein AP1_004 [Aeromonas phage